MHRTWIAKGAVVVGSLVAVLALSAIAHGASVARTDRLKGAPFYKTYKKHATAQNSAVAHLPVRLHAMMGDEFFYAGRERALQPLIEAMDAYLDSLNWSQMLAAPLPEEKGAPYVYVGSAEGEGAPAGAQMERMDHEKYPPMIIHLQKPSSEWRGALGALVETSSAEYVLFITVGMSEYPKGDKGLFGKKVVLGTGHAARIKFLSAEDKPVEVLQVLGVLLDRQGTVLRAGAEGIMASDSPFWVQILEAARTIDDEALQRLLSEERRADLDGAPLAWQVALRNLVAQLLARPSLVLK